MFIKHLIDMPSQLILLRIVWVKRGNCRVDISFGMCKCSLLSTL